MPSKSAVARSDYPNGWPEAEIERPVMKIERADKASERADGHFERSEYKN